MLLTLVAITKRAQIPFSAWLPAAIAAPTPVSSLVHSSTLVTAGVYLLIRLNYLLEGEAFLTTLTLLGAITIGLAGISALFETDIKKIIALSTLRQLGIIFFTLGLNLPLLAFFHLLAHAYFKAMLFMCAGNIIHRIKEYQDLRLMGGALKFLPLSASIATVANLSLCGVPFLTGFFSKDLILETMIISKTGLVIFFLAALATRLTVAYSVRLTKLIFSGVLLQPSAFLVREGDSHIFSGILALLAPSVAGGMLLS